MAAVMSDLPKRNGQPARHVGDRTPDRTQRLLNRASWDTMAAMGAVRGFAVAGLDQAAARRRAGGRCWMRPVTRSRACNADIGITSQRLCRGRLADSWWARGVPRSRAELSA